MRYLRRFDNRKHSTGDCRRSPEEEPAGGTRSPAEGAAAAEAEAEAEEGCSSSRRLGTFRSSSGSAGRRRPRRSSPGFCRLGSSSRSPSVPAVRPLWFPTRSTDRRRGGRRRSPDLRPPATGDEIAVVFSSSSFLVVSATESEEEDEEAEEIFSFAFNLFKSQ